MEVVKTITVKLYDLTDPIIYLTLRIKVKHQSCQSGEELQLLTSILILFYMTFPFLSRY